MAKELILKGSVQGVCCRAYCRQNAKKLKIHGSATNLSNGNVRVLLDSNDENMIREFIYAIKTNQYHFSFYGEIQEVEVNDYNGQIRGDYVF